MKKKCIMLFLCTTMLGGTLSGCGRIMEQETSNAISAPEMDVEEGGQLEEAYGTEKADSAIYDLDGATTDAEEFVDEYYEMENTEEYSAIEENGFVDVASHPLSTFSSDVDTASYSNLRRMIEEGYSLEEIPADAVRIEELLNYFQYDYNLPEEDEPFGVTMEMATCPWNAEHDLLMIGLKTEEIDFSESAPSNLVFLLDVSGSMYDEDKLPLLQKSFSMLTENLTEKDRVSIVTYAGSDEIVLAGARGNEKEEILEAIDQLEAGGSTNGSAGIETAYELAEKYFIKGGNNRVILATDGDLNVGIVSEDELEELITEKKKSNIFLSVLGFGTGNLKDNKMETLADCGNGNYAYIDGLTEARKTLVEEMGSTLVTVAKDVKLQIEFNPAYISSYRQIGYENRALAAKDFADDTKDAGEIGAGHTVTALYEIVPADATQGIELKYQEQPVENEEVIQEWFTLKVRYKRPEADTSVEKVYPADLEIYTEEPSENWQFAAAVAEFGQVVRDSAYKEDSSLEHVLSTLRDIDLGDDIYKNEFYDLVRLLLKR